MKFPSSLLLGLLLLISTYSFAQNTYQKIYEGPEHCQNFDTQSTRDGGMIMTGILDDGNDQRVFVSKTDCHGILEWTNLYHHSSSIGNTGSKILVLPNGGYLLACNIGNFQHYDLCLLRLDDQGNSLWEKIMLGARDDVLRDLLLTPDGGFVVVGGTNSYGEEENTSSLSYKDIYICKLNSEGEALWSKTFGTPNTTDEAYAVINTKDGGYALTGRYIDRAAFQVLWLKLDAQGEMEAIKCYGDSLSRNYAYDIIQDDAGNYLISGSTTLEKAQFNSPPDVFLLKLDPAGDLLWARSYLPLEADHSDAGTALIALDTGFVLSVATHSFYTPGVNVQNKFLLLHTDLDGHLRDAASYTKGYSHFPKIAKTYDQSAYILTGFTTEITNPFSPLLLQLDANFQGACEIKNQSSNLQEVDTEFIPNIPNTTSHQGANWIDTSFAPDSFALETWILCHSVDMACTPPLSTSIAQSPTAFEIFPNPAKDQLNISFEDFQHTALHLAIINIQGQIVKQQILAPNQSIQLNISTLPSGIYQIRLWNQQFWRTEQFIKLSSSF